MVKPKIFPKPRIGKNKFEEALRKDSEISKKEIALLSVPKKITNISEIRERNLVTIDSKKFRYAFFKYYRKSKSKKNRSQLLHTHITDPLKKKIGTALPSITDIRILLSYALTYNQKYNIIGVIDGKTNKPIGYTTIKINVNLRNNDVIFKELIKNLNLENLKNKVCKKKLVENLSKIGLEVYFTPETGYKLDKNFNYVPEK